MRLNEFTEQSVEEGYYDLNDDGMQPIDLSANPSFKEIVQRYTQLVYQGHTSETSPEEDQEYDAIEQYVAQRFGEKGSAHLQKAGEVSYWGRDDKPYGRDSRSSNLGRPNQPGGNFRTTKAGKMHGQDAKMMKAKVADRLGRHPEPTLPEGVEQDVSEVRGDKDRHINDPLDGENIFTGRPGVSKRALARLKALLTVRLFPEDELRMMHLYDVVQDKQLFDIIKYAKRHAPPKTDLRNYEPFSSRIQTLIARAEKKLNLNQSQEQSVAEGNYDDNRTGFSRGPRDDERHDLDTPRPTIYALKINGKIWQKDGNVVTFFTKERALAARNSILNKRPELEVGLVQRQG